MKRVLVVHGKGGASQTVRLLLSQRADGVIEVQAADSLETARALLRKTDFDVVVVGGGERDLRLATFQNFLKATRSTLPVVSLDETTTAERVVDQLFSRFGLERSVTFDQRRTKEIGFAGNVSFDHVESNGVPFLRAQILQRDVVRDALPTAQRAGQLSGPGLAVTVESFWDDPRPHLLQHVPAGVSLNRLLRQRDRPWMASLALAIGRGIADGVATLHAAEVSAGTLRGPSIWLTDDGEVLLLGHGLTQLPYTTQTYYGLPSEAPPEEYGTAMAPQVPGDAFRLGLLVCELATGTTPVSRMTPVEYLQRTWTAELDAELAGLAPLLQAESVDRPRGELLRSLLDALAPAARKSLVAEAVAWSRVNPELQW